MNYLLPGGLIALGLWALTRQDGVSDQPSFTPQALDAFTEMRGGARHFKPEVATQIMTMLGSKSLEMVGVQGGSPGPVFKVVPFSVGLTAREAALSANSQGMVVMASLSLAIVQDPSDKLLMIVSASQRGIAQPTSQFAILLDAGSPAVVAPGVPPGTLPGTVSPFDPGMSPELVKEVNAMLSDPDANPEALERAATTLEKSGFPIAAKALRDRANAIRLKQRLGDEKAGGTPFTIRKGAGGVAVDLPFHVANHYTGDGMRFKEIVPINRGMIMKDGNVSPWVPGSTILLPLSWEVRSKPLPTPLGVSKKSSNGKKSQSELDDEAARRESQRMKEADAKARGLS